MTTTPPPTFLRNTLLGATLDPAETPDTLHLEFTLRLTPQATHQGALQDTLLGATPLGVIPPEAIHLKAVRELLTRPRLAITSTASTQAPLLIAGPPGFPSNRRLSSNRNRPTTPSNQWSLLV